MLQATDPRVNVQDTKWGCLASCAAPSPEVVRDALEMTLFDVYKSPVYMCMLESLEYKPRKKGGKGLFG